MTDAELAWAAGLFEGEGSVTVCRGRPRLSLKMVDPEPVHRFSAIVGGKVYGPYGPYKSAELDGYPRHPYMMWALEGPPAEALIHRLAPLLSSTRRARVDEVFGVIT